jgi:hypothetical protein
MRKPASDMYQFNLDRGHYLRTRNLSILLIGLVLLCSALFISGGIALWGTYSHNFTPYLKWQDALVAMCWYMGCFVCWGICLLLGRFVHALRSGYRQGMVNMQGQDTITVRDLSPENIKSPFWIANSAFWCFFAALIGLSPAILFGWTLHLANPVLSLLTTIIAALLSLAGIVVVLVAVFFVIVGIIGMVTFTRKLGSSHTYQLNGQASVRIDNFVLTIIYPGTAESMVDLHLLAPKDQLRLLSLLHRRWIDGQQVWSPSLGEEIAQALEFAEAS